VNPVRYACASDRRRQLLQQQAVLNGIDFVEVPAPDQLRVVFVNPIAVPPAPDQVEVTGERDRIGVSAVRETGDPAAVVLILEHAGGPGAYTVGVVRGPGDPRPPAGIDPVLSVAQFGFMPQCVDAPCGDPAPCPPAAVTEPALDYLVKDWEGFRRLMLDRLAVLQPDWTRRNLADVRVALVELVAYLADQASYRQDAVATEAYLGTARRRISVRRHVRLVDYPMSDGTNARTWLQIALAEGDVLTSGGSVPVVPVGTRFLTAGPDDAVVLKAGSTAEAKARAAGALEFQALSALDVVSGAHTGMRFYTWEGARCCLPAGSTGATLDGHLPDLAAGQVLVLVEQRDPVGPRHLPEDADPAHRYPVRLTEVSAWATPGAPLTDPLTGHQITEVRWSTGDALPNPLTVSVDIDGVAAGDAALALGNIVLVDHGGWAPVEQFEPVQSGRFQPRLAVGPVTQVPHQLIAEVLADGSGTHQVLRPYDPRGPARLAIGAPADAVLPAVSVTDADGPWTVQRDLLGSGANRDFVVEVDDEAVAWLRFGRQYGDLPDAGTPPRPGVTMTTRYRTGNGVTGNVGAGAIRQLLDDGTAAASLVEALGRGGLGNPVPAYGGTEPETIEAVRQRAPFVFRSPERAVTADDYARRAELFALPDSPGTPAVQRAVATVRWTGSWYTVVVAVDRFGGADVDPDFADALVAYLDRYRMAGHDVQVVGASYVPVEVGLRLRVRDDHRRDLVRAYLMDVLSSRRLPDGRPGLFNPDSLTFGQPVYLGPILAAAQAVPGVAYVTEVTRFARYRQPGTDARDTGRIELSDHEIARLDNDPSRPEHGIVRLDGMEGGR
jgi:hypothetical protein